MEVTGVGSWRARTWPFPVHVACLLGGGPLGAGCELVYGYPEPMGLPAGFAFGIGVLDGGRVLRLSAVG